MDEHFSNPALCNSLSDSEKSRRDNKLSCHRHCGSERDEVHIEHYVFSMLPLNLKSLHKSARGKGVHEVDDHRARENVPARFRMTPEWIPHPCSVEPLKGRFLSDIT